MNTAPRTFDDAKLSTMVEPLTVRVDKIKGSTRMPIPLPEGDSGETPGTEWTKDAVRGLEQFLVSQWSGGGLYEIAITDSSTPTPVTMKWSPFWHTTDYPERVPPPLVGVASAATPPAPIQPPAPQRPMSAFPNGLPFFQPGAQGQPYAAPQQYPQYPGYAYALPPPPQVGSPSWPAWQAEASRTRESEELRTLRDENRRREAETIAAKHAAELDRERQASEQRFQRYETQMADIRNMMATLAQTVQHGAASSKPNAELEAIKAQLENEKREREAERRERETRDALKATQEASQRQFELMQRSLEAMQARLTEANTNKSDPLLAMVQEQARQHADAIKEIARNQAASLERIQGFMMNPRDMFMMAKESNASTEQATERISKLFGSVIDVQQKVTENLLQMQPGGSGALDVVRDGLNSVKELAERYVGSKATNERIAMQAQAQVATAQAQAYAAAHGAQQPAQPVQVAPSPTISGLAGPTGETQVAQTSSAKPKANGKANGKKDDKADKKPIIITGPGAKRLGKTDAEWFGPLIANVEELREGVDLYLESLSMDPPRVNTKGEPEGLSPEGAAMTVAGAVGTVMQHNLMIPVMRDLLFQDRFADFFDVLLPNAPQAYRDDTTQAFVALAKKLNGTADETPVTDQSASANEDEDGEDEDGADEATAA